MRNTDNQRIRSSFVTTEINSSNEWKIHLSIDTFEQILLNLLNAQLTTTNRVKNEKLSVCTKMLKQYLLKGLINRPQISLKHRSVVAATLTPTSWAQM